MRKGLSLAAGIRRSGLFLVASSILLSGCQGFPLTYKGAKVLETYRIALGDGTQRSGRYHAPDLTIDYSVVRYGDDLELSGVAEYTPKIKNGFGLVTYFHLGVFLADQGGNILQATGIRTPGSDDPSSRMRFSEKIHLPPGTVNMAFNYSIEARGAGSRETSSFWGIPIVR